MSFLDLQQGGFVHPVHSPVPKNLEALARQRAERLRVEREALRKLAHYAADAEDYRRLAEALGLDPDLLKGEEAG